MKIKYTFILILAALFLSNCSNMQETVQIQTATPVPPTLTPTITLTPTETLIPTPTPVVISTFDRQDKEISGQYTETQMNLIESGLFSEDENQLQNWFEYWMKFTNSPFNPASLNLQYKYVFDSTDPTGKSAGVLLENLETGKTFYLPIKNGQYMTIPQELPKSEAELTDVPEGFGPLELSGGDYILAWRNEGWVRMDTEGNIRETLNLETAQWEEAQQYIELPMTDGETYKMMEFDTSDEALEYISKNAMWYSGDIKEALDHWLTTDEAYNYFPDIKKIVGRESRYDLNIPDGSNPFHIISTSDLGEGSVIIFRNMEGEFISIYVNEKAEVFEPLSGTYDFSKYNSESTNTP